MLALRPYQKEAFSTLLQALRQDRFVLLQAAIGAGKTILFSALIQHCVEHFGMRVALSGKTPPKTVEQAMKRAKELNMPEKIIVKKDNHYFNVLKW